MAGEETNQQQTTGADPFAVLLQALSGGAATAPVGTGYVYLGAKKTPTAKGTIRGQRIDMSGMSEDVVSTQQAIANYLNNPKTQTGWRKVMQRYGLETGNPLAERKAYEAAVLGAADWFSTSNGQQKVTPEQYLGWYAGGLKKAAGPDLTRQVYQYSPEQIDADINDVAFKVLGREITDQDKSADWYKELTGAINKMVSKGTTTEVKQVRNPKTGKLEQVVTQTPKFTKEKAEAAITEAVEIADPETLERKKNLDFANWAFEKMGGRG